MNDSKLEDFKLWMDSQPDYCSYTRVRKFLAGHLSVSNSQAEVEMAKLQESGEIKIIARKSGKSGRRVFKRPLDPLEEAHIRAVWDGSSSVTKDANQIAVAVHDMTGHDPSEVKSFMDDLDNATLRDDSFKWEEDLHDDSDEYIR